MTDPHEKKINRVNGLERKAYTAKKPCGAKKRDGTLCRKPAINGRNRCRLHGGASPAPGPLHPNYRGGDPRRRSRHFPKAVADLVDEALSDKELLSIRDTVAIFTARSYQLRQRLGTGESSAAWENLKRLWDEFEAANRRVSESKAELDRGDPTAKDRINEYSQIATSALREIGKIIRESGDTEAAWGELLSLEGAATEIRGEEINRLKALKTVMTYEQVLLMVHSLQLAIGEIITDHNQRKRIGQAFVAIVNSPAATEILESADDDL